MTVDSGMKWEQGWKTSDQETGDTGMGDYMGKMAGGVEQNPIGGCLLLYRKPFDIQTHVPQYFH